MRVEFIQTKRSIEKDMYCISAIGRISRSKKTLKENFENLSSKDHLEFNEKWYKKSKHRSLGDLASVHLDISGISIVAAKILEISRIGVGFCEFSTRYVDIEKNNFEDLYYTPLWVDNNDDTTLKDQYNHIMDMHFNAYKNFKKSINEKIDEHNKSNSYKHKYKKIENLNDKEILDNARYSLPTSTKVGLGIHCNVRALESIIIKLKWYSVMFSEIKLLYNKLKDLILSNKALASTIDIEKIDSINLSEAFESSNNRIYWNLMQLLCREDIMETPKSTKLPSSLSKIFSKFYTKIKITSKFYNNITSFDLSENNLNYPIFLKYDQCKIFNLFSSYETNIHNSIVDKYLEENNISSMFHNEDFYIPREFELKNYIFRCNIDYGAFRDISRHRMCSMIYLPIPINIQLKLSIFKDQYYLSPIMSKLYENYKEDYEIFKKSNKSYKILFKIESYKLLFFNLKKLQIMRYQNCKTILERYDNQEGFFKAIEWLTYTQPLSAAINFDISINLREAIKLVNQRETKAGHPSYIEFAKKLRENIIINSNNNKIESIE